MRNDKKEFSKIRTISHNYPNTLSVPEEIVDNSDLGDPEGMLQLSRVTHHYHLKSHKKHLLVKEIYNCT